MGKMKTKKRHKRVHKTKRKRNRMSSTGGNILNFKTNLTNNVHANAIVEIGRGGGGIVYVDNSQPNIVFKVSKKENICRTWNNEKNIYDKLGRHQMDTDLCKFIKMLSFENNGNSCFLELSRVFNPIDTAAPYAIHPQFGKTSINIARKGRGLFLGIKELIENGIFTEESITDYVKDLAISISRLHYIGQNDGFDIEVFVGVEPDATRSSRNRCPLCTPTLFIGDFDLSEMIVEYNDYTIGRMVWCLYTVPYFPRKGVLLDVFSKYYIESATGHEEIAAQVIEIYTKDCLYD
jgi:hypothetical protein